MTRAPEEQSFWSRYCRQCFYDLRGLPENRCPECGLSFDPDRPETFSRSPGPQRLRDLVRRAKSNLKPPAKPLFPLDPHAAQLIKLSRRVAALTVENDQLWDHFVWLLGIMMEKGVVTEADIEMQVRREEWGTLPVTAAEAEIEIVDDSIEEEPEPQPSEELLDLKHAAEEEKAGGTGLEKRGNS
ncbi:MAG TPA: hypothetical protein VFE47_26180 [Tepidisphaeraceae bacterium]|jgi:hypothetical protein|nr:hypothetical protein [Tepidisphaeraceae bacterium]